MKARLLSGLFLLSLTLPGFGQGRDTVFAVRKLFREKRATGESLLATGNIVASGAQYAARPDGRPTAQETRQDAIASAAFAGTGMAKEARYSAEREDAVVKLYNEGWAIPADIRRKLRRKYFHRTARDLRPN
jgi:hypothetical protein